MADGSDTRLDVLDAGGATQVALPVPETVAEGLIQSLREMGVRHAFGVCGGAQALLWAALSRRLDVLHFRHEAGAAFAAAEACLANGTPVVVFTTTGPGITNALTGLVAARTEGAKVVLVSAYASAPQRGRGGIQETSGYTMPTGGLFEAGAWFDDAVILESPDQLPQVLRRIEAGFDRPGGYVAHVSIPNAIQGAPLAQPFSSRAHATSGERGRLARPGVNHAAVARCATLLAAEPFAIWVGFGARNASAALRAFVDRTGAPVMCSPRAKGLLPEDHPGFVGVTGMGGHADATATFMRTHAPRRILVLGTRLGEPTSFWNNALVPPDGFIHVDVDPRVPGVAFPQAETFAVQADARDFLEALLSAWPADVPCRPMSDLARPHPIPPAPGSDGHGAARVRPAALMAAVQRLVVDRGNAVVLAESGNAFTWATNYLRFSQPDRYRVSTNVGSMGHAATGVIGAAIVRGAAVAIVGDGAMLMNSEVNTAVKRQARAVWIVLNDGRYNMCHQGMAALGMSGVADALFPPVDFARQAQALGADGARVEREDMLEAALEAALAAPGPYVLDVLIDPDQIAPTRGRNEGLRAAQAVLQRDGLSFPVIAAN